MLRTWTNALRTNYFYQIFLILLLIEFVDLFVGVASFPRVNLLHNNSRVHIIRLALDLIIVIPLTAAWARRNLTEASKTRSALEEAQLNCQSLFVHNPDGVFLMSSDGRFVDANPSFLRLVNCTLSELTEMEKHPFLTNKNRDTVLKYFSLAKFGQSQRYECEFVNNHGEAFILDMTYFPQYRDGLINGIYGVVQNVTQEKQVEKELRQTRQLLSSFIDNTTDAILIYHLDTKTQTTNPAFTRMFGWESPNLTYWNSLHVPAELRDEALNLYELAKNNHPTTGVETIRLRKDRTPLDVSVSVSPVKDISGNTLAVAYTYRDVSHHKRIVRTLDEVSQRFKSILTHAGDAISVLDQEGKLLMANPAWENLFGWKESEVVGKYCPTLQSFPHLDSVLNGHSYVAIEQKQVRRDGSYIYVLVTANVIQTANHEVNGVVFIYKDITEQKKAEEHLLRTEKLKLAGELAASIAHEIRNPLAAIQGFMQLMKETYEPRYLDIVLNEVQRISDITNELLLLAKPQTTKISLINVVDAVHEVVTLLDGQLNIHGINLHLELPTIDKPRAYCILGHFKQAIINVLKNAIEAMPGGGQVWVRVFQPTNSETVTIQVQDTGVGIDEDKIRDLGQPFYTTKERGTGLGLTVTYRIIQNYGGKIQISSRLGQGTIVNLSLPAVSGA